MLGDREGARRNFQGRVCGGKTVLPYHLIRYDTEQWALLFHPNKSS